jgi:hypothetical protein
MVSGTETGRTGTDRPSLCCSSNFRRTGTETGAALLFLEHAIELVWHFFKCRWL